MSPSKEADTSSALDTAETSGPPGASGDPIIPKLKIALRGKETYDGPQEKAVQALTAVTRIGECLAEVSPIYSAAWNGRTKYPQSAVRHGTDERSARPQDLAETLAARAGSNGKSSKTAINR
jgi:hypothetical protein